MARLKEAYINEQGIRISTVTGKPVREYKKQSKYWDALNDLSSAETKEEVEQVIVHDPLYEKLSHYYTQHELEVMVERKENASPVELIELKRAEHTADENNVGIIVASDWHADETVKASTVLGKNEFNESIARARIENFFQNAVKVAENKAVNELIFASLGDMVGGWIHDELAQTNSMSPMSGIAMVKKLIVSGLKFIYDNMPHIEKITFIGICGNHTRTTKKMQFANGFELSHEFFMYQDIKSTCELLGMDNMTFIIPESEFAYLDVYGRKLLFCHGHQFKTSGGVGGIYPSMLRWFGKMNQTIKIDKAFIGHYHTSIWTKEVCVNGSIKGYDAFAMGHGLPFEEPKQTYVILNEKRGFIFYTPIFVD